MTEIELAADRVERDLFRVTLIEIKAREQRPRTRMSYDRERRVRLEESRLRWRYVLNLAIGARHM